MKITETAAWVRWRHGAKVGKSNPRLVREKAFGNTLRHIRRRQGFSQERLALDSGFDRTYISLVERGLRSPTVRAVVKLAEVLEVPPSEIVKRMEREIGEEA